MDRHWVLPGVVPREIGNITFGVFQSEHITWVELEEMSGNLKSRNGLLKWRTVFLKHAHVLKDKLRLWTFPDKRRQKISDPRLDFVLDPYLRLNWPYAGLCPVREMYCKGHSWINWQNQNSNSWSKYQCYTCCSW